MIKYFGKIKYILFSVCLFDFVVYFFWLVVFFLSSKDLTGDNLSCTVPVSLLWTPFCLCVSGF